MRYTQTEECLSALALIHTHYESDINNIVKIYRKTPTQTCFEVIIIAVTTLLDEIIFKILNAFNLMNLVKGRSEPPL